MSGKMILFKVLSQQITILSPGFRWRTHALLAVAARQSAHPFCVGAEETSEDHMINMTSTSELEVTGGA